MRRVFAFICLLLISGSIAAQKSPFRIKTAHLTGNIYVYTSYGEFNNTVYAANAVYALTDSGVVIIDTPWSEDQTQQLLDTIEQRHHLKVIACIVTHFHEDRTAGLNVMKKHGVITYSTALTKELCKEHNNPQAERTIRNDVHHNIDGLKLQTFFPGEGHSKDNIVVWFPQSKVLYGGCFIKSAEAKDIGNVADGNVKAWPASLARVKKQFPNPKYVIPGHDDWHGTVKAIMGRTTELVNQQR
ncbi:BlaB/IND/MUS family subclass B1 metallo-beta-lactamase [Chitinophaga arvensicola]|uniref:beta-lactamase n=1 Tax=Chitinophaga arvensicola TaxID=29529 RepID=A0A1I0S7D8_9BACT|nr:BlaB/IND/MUS family subclass B1 metallo-beta-lactamase [Chitinophaga arvensicola]SEW51648.1 metallo-beta-lactamase class B [Chitinophaga arvensicola]